MAYINLNLYEEIEAKDFIEYVKSRHPQCNLMSNKELLDYLDELWDECVAYLDA